MQERLDVCAKNLNFLSRTCELCNEHDHFSTQCKLFHARIVSKNCDDLISLAHHNELSLLLGYEEIKHITKIILEFALDRILHFDLEEIICIVRWIALKILILPITQWKENKYKMKRILMKGKRLPNILLLFLMMNQVTRKSILSNQSH